MRIFVSGGLFIALMLIQSTGNCESFKDNIDSLLVKIASENAPGGSILVAEKGKVLYQRSFGLANLEKNIPNTLETNFAWLLLPNSLLPCAS